MHESVSVAHRGLRALKPGGSSTNEIRWSLLKEQLLWSRMRRLKGVNGGIKEKKNWSIHSFASFLYFSSCLNTPNVPGVSRIQQLNDQSNAAAGPSRLLLDGPGNWSGLTGALKSLWGGRGAGRSGQTSADVNQGGDTSTRCFTPLQF